MAFPHTVTSMDYTQRIGADVIGFSETNLWWTRKLQQQYTASAHRVHGASKLCTSHHADGHRGDFQPGGTVTCVAGQ